MFASARSLVRQSRTTRANFGRHINSMAARRSASTSRPIRKIELQVGDQVSYWRRDKGSPRSEYVTAEVVEVETDADGFAVRCKIQRDDTHQEREIDPLRLKVIKLALPPPEEEAPF